MTKYLTLIMLCVFFCLLLISGTYGGWSQVLDVEGLVKYQDNNVINEVVRQDGH
jgi:hypothetical protein